MNQTKSPSRNRTLNCSIQEIADLSRELAYLMSDTSLKTIENKIIHQDIFEAAPHLPIGLAELLVLDPPYNLSKNYNGYLFKEKEKSEYQEWFAGVVKLVKPMLKPTATVYVCSDWRTSVLIAPILEKEFRIQNRITWEREKGRGAKYNWKNNTEDIWFCTVSEQYRFNLDAVKLKRKVIAPYRTEDGRPKDWQAEAGGNFRLTHPSNIWTDITIPFWSMPENTKHPTQKPEKLIAKLVLASSNPGEMVLDPFLGSGTTAVVAKKLGRRFVGVEINQEYCCWALKRLAIAQEYPSIQGYADGVFWERNTLSAQ
ncbi:MAG: site-specific DNA-methyltransferase, partial [Hormoscilla sp.]